jgi:hypothetical protein
MLVIAKGEDILEVFNQELLHLVNHLRTVKNQVDVIGGKVGNQNEYGKDYNYLCGNGHNPDIFNFFSENGVNEFHIFLLFKIDTSYSTGSSFFLICHTKTIQNHILLKTLKNGQKLFIHAIMKFFVSLL